MFRSIKELLGYQIMAKDGQIGKVEDLFFSDESWIVRYLVADTGPWIFGRKVLVSMQALGHPVWASQTFPVELTREQVENSPNADLAKPVSRQYEEKLFEHYRWQSYWAMSNVVPGRSFFIPPNLFRDPNEPVDENDLETHLRSTRELLEYRVVATDGEAGSVKDFIIDDEGWQLKYMVVDVGDALELENEKMILVALEWIKFIRIADKEILIDLNREAIKFSPPFDPNLAVNRQYEEVLYDYHGRPKYWQVVDRV